MDGDAERRRSLHVHHRSTGVRRRRRLGECGGNLNEAINAHFLEGERHKYGNVVSNASHDSDTELEESLVFKQRLRPKKWRAYGSNFQPEDDDLALAISLSTETTEQQKAARELLVVEKREDLGVHNLLHNGKKKSSCTSQFEIHPTMVTPDTVAAFMRITGAPEFVAVQKLEEYAGNLNEAINAHFLEGGRLILSGQGQNLAAVPQYNNSGASNQSHGRGSSGIFPFLNAARRFRPSLLLDPNYRRELRDLYNGIGGGASAFTNHPPSLTSHPAEVGEVPARINSAFGPHYQSALNTTGADLTGNLSSQGLGTPRTDGYQNEYPFTQSNASHVPDTDIEEAMLQAAIEASRKERRGGSSREQIDALNDSSDGGLSQSHFQQEDDELARAISLSLKSAEQEKAIRELLVVEEKNEVGVHDVLDKGNKINSSRSQFELGTSSNQSVAQDVAQSVLGHSSNQSAGGYSQQNEDVLLADNWGGISSEELNEALLVETAFFGSNYGSHNFSSLPNLQRPEKNVDPKMQYLSTSMSQLLADSRLLKQQQDADYLASLQADKQKELSSLNKAESLSSKEEESCKKMLEEKKLGATHDKKEVMLSKEPMLCDEVITIVVRMPDGGRCERRFLKTDKLELLFYFVDICGAQKPGTYRLVKSYPRCAYSINDCSSTFNEVGLNKNKEALFLELI
ncbi:hypothetical protein VNO78_25328 [Psophocarpus tetragonolobus]|uniref:UBX domain-containing protein n=1 Tax=Psophocarpus tetragonolobus TaxID=3891 RepID=A0AAN9XF79_PSOTE